MYFYSSLLPLRTWNSWKSENYRKSNREKKPWTKVQNGDKKWSKVVKSDNFCYHKVGRAITKWGWIEKSSILLLQYWKNSQFKPSYTTSHFNQCTLFDSNFYVRNLFSRFLGSVTFYIILTHIIAFNIISIHIISTHIIFNSCNFEKIWFFFFTNNFLFKYHKFGCINIKMN